jgi:hypothetical protein
VSHELEILVREQRGDVVARAGKEVVDAKNIMPVGDKALAQVRAKETCATGYQYAFAE